MLLSKEIFVNLYSTDNLVYHTAFSMLLNERETKENLLEFLLLEFISQPVSAKSHRIFDLINHIPMGSLNRMVQSIESEQHNHEKETDHTPLSADQSLLLMAYGQLTLHHFLDAERKFNQFLAKQPKNLHGLFGLASTLRMQHQYQKAIQILLKCCDLDPQSSIYLNRIGLIYTDQQQYSKAEEVFRKATELVLDDIHSWIDWAWIHIEQRNFARAEELLQQAMKYDPKESLIYSGLGDVLSLQDKLEDSILFYEKAMALDPYSLHIWKNMGLTYIDLENYHKAEECFQKMQMLDPDKSDSYLSLAWLFMEQEKYTDAIGVLQKAMVIDPSNGEIYLDIAKCYRELGNDTNQLKFLQLAVRYDAMDPDAHYSLGMYYSEHERFDQAKRAFQSALQVNPSHILSLNSLAAIEVDINENFSQAITLYKKALDVDPKNMLTYVNMGLAYLNAELYDESERCFQKVLELDPHDVSALNNMGVMARDIKNDYPLAEKYFIKVLQEQPEFLPAIMDLIELYAFYLKDEVKTGDWLIRLKDMYPDDTEVDEFIQQISVDMKKK